MQKVITVNPQPKFKPSIKEIVKKVLRPIATVTLTAIELFEKIDEQFFMEDDTWQMRVMFYGFYIIGVPSLIVFFWHMFM